MNEVKLKEMPDDWTEWFTTYILDGDAGRVVDHSHSAGHYASAYEPSEIDEEVTISYTSTNPDAVPLWEELEKFEVTFRTRGTFDWKDWELQYSIEPSEVTTKKITKDKSEPTMSVTIYNQ